MITTMNLCEIGKLIFGSIEGCLIGNKILPCLAVSVITNKILVKCHFFMVRQLVCLSAFKINHGIKLVGEGGSLIIHDVMGAWLLWTFTNTLCHKHLKL